MQMHNKKYENTLLFFYKNILREKARLYRGHIIELLFFK